MDFGGTCHLDHHQCHDELARVKKLGRSQHLEQVDHLSCQLASRVSHITRRLYLHQRQSTTCIVIKHQIRCNSQRSSHQAPVVIRFAVPPSDCFSCACHRSDIQQRLTSQWEIEHPLLRLWTLKPTCPLKIQLYVVPRLLCSNLRVFVHVPLKPRRRSEVGDELTTNWVSEPGGDMRLPQYGNRLSVASESNILRCYRVAVFGNRNIQNHSDYTRNPNTERCL